MLLTALLQIFACCLVLPAQVSAFYFYTTGAERKCFHKELSRGTLFQGTYKAQIYDDDLKGYRDAGAQDFGVVIDIEETFDDDHLVVHQKGSASGDYTFIALESGEHKVCIQPEAGGWLIKAKTKIEVNFQVGTDEKLDSKGKTTIDILHAKVNVLNSKISEVRREQQLMRDREATFRDASESVNSRAMWWIVIQLIVLTVTCGWQMKHLGKFFVKQKIL
ncbi:hypothetical protein SEUBUCD646_0A00760 [Saccharomyces eubayanus]|uniref:Emp24p/erv25p-protein n=2 Tax=Saccharomyces TaxID=4930 RepID=A0A6C1E3A5_SACPS|nr:ERP1-like protein [Saccharomyces eubayanus]KOH01392.1 ERP1-like protein [Saccharomyces eubayanus]QID83217.1 emp24p/erv25p- protein [Saccharomyces pastorianus]CAI1795652.1 hypothetical protein SEUBUCD650_0A00750 [Saccharomyces eubayanus]CAI1832812.1 hypothetical protein SEUBUCD646_0A00760 [Saccharomyces eubayanus]